MKPWNARIDGEDRYLFRNNSDRQDYIKKHQPDERTLGLLAIALFWTDPEMDYIAYTTIDDEGEHWKRNFDNFELLSWLGGVALSEDRRQLVDLSERQKGSFADMHGWTPDVVIEYGPSEQEKECYIDYQAERIDREWEQFDV